MPTVGEPIEPEVWRWYFEKVGKAEAVIVDTWWQTETGGFLGSTLPGIDPMKPGSCGPGALGIYPAILDEDGTTLPAGSGKAGNIGIRNPWPGVFQTIYGQPDRFVSTYYAKYNKNPDSKDWRDWPYFAGDGATEAADGYFRIPGGGEHGVNEAGGRPPAGDQGIRFGRAPREGGPGGGRGPGGGWRPRPRGRDVRGAQARLRA